MGIEIRHNLIFLPLLYLNILCPIPFGYLWMNSGEDLIGFPSFFLTKGPILPQVLNIPIQSKGKLQSHIQFWAPSLLPPQVWSIIWERAMVFSFVILSWFCFFFYLLLLAPPGLGHRKGGWKRKGKDMCTEFMLFVGSSWLLVVRVVSLQVLAPLWVLCGLLCALGELWMPWWEIHSTVGLFQTLPLSPSALPYTDCIASSFPLVRLKPCSLPVFTEPMGKTLLLAIPNSAFLCSSFPFPRWHPHLLQSLVGGRRQTLCSQMPLNTSASMSGSSENYPTIFFSRDLSISVA